LVAVKTVAVLSWGILNIERMGMSCSKSQPLTVSSVTYLNAF